MYNQTTEVITNHKLAIIIWNHIKQTWIKNRITFIKSEMLTKSQKDGAMT